MLARMGDGSAGSPALERLPYREIWCLDFEFRAPDGERPEPHCMVARELRSGRELRLWRDELELGRPPFRLDEEALFVAYYASAELGCFLALGWPMPARVLDLFAEFRVTTNGRQTPCGSGLLGALAYYGLDSMVADEKEEMRALAMRGGPYTTDERQALLTYCAADVDALARLLPAMLPGILSRQRDPSAGAGPSPPAGPVHGRRGPDGVERHPDRCAHARAAAGGVGRDQDGADRRGRCAVWRVRRHHVQGRPVRGLPRAGRHPLATPAQRGAGA